MNNNLLPRLTLAFFLWYIIFAFLDDLIAGTISRAFSPIWFLALAAIFWLTNSIIRILKS